MHSQFDVSGDTEFRDFIVDYILSVQDAKKNAAFCQVATLHLYVKCQLSTKER